MPNTNPILKCEVIEKLSLFKFEVNPLNFALEIPFIGG